MTTDLSKTCRVAPCRKCGERFASNDPAARVCGDGTCDVDPEGIDGLRGGEGRDVDQMEASATYLAWTVVALGVVALCVLAYIVADGIVKVTS
jgi:hypothetical protein